MINCIKHRLKNIPITKVDIISQVRSLNIKSSGPDGISARMSSISDESIVLPLKIIFSNILTTGIYPDVWKQAILTPIHKKGSKQLVSNYRPTSLLPICSKLFERIVFKYLYNYLVSNNLITKNQSGFRPGGAYYSGGLLFGQRSRSLFASREAPSLLRLFGLTLFGLYTIWDGLAQGNLRLRKA